MSGVRRSASDHREYDVCTPFRLHGIDGPARHAVGLAYPLRNSSDEGNVARFVDRAVNPDETDIARVGVDVDH